MGGVRLGVLGGTFDPPHLGHLVLAESARTSLGLSSVLFVPAAEPWRKAGRAITAAEHRVEMVRLAIAGNKAFELSLIEVERGGPSYTADTLVELQTQRPGADLYFIVGEDALLDLPNWKDPQRIIELARIAVAPRGDGGRRLPEDFDRLLPGLAARVVSFEMPAISVSATDLRARAARGESIRYLVPETVERYIAEHRLYAGE